MPDAGPDQLQQCVIEGFRSLGVADPEAVGQTILLRENRFAGRRFRCDRLQTVWLAGEDVLRFYDGEGNLLHTASLEGELMKRAA